MISWWVFPLAIFGFANAGYIKWKRSKHKKLKCLIGDGDCDAVVNSKYNSMLGVSNEVIGMAFYAGVTGAILFINLITTSIQGISLVLVLLIIESISMFFSIILTVIQALVLRQWCEYCIIAAIINAFIWAITFFS